MLEKLLKKLMGEKHYFPEPIHYCEMHLHGTPYAYNEEKNIIILRPYNIVFQEREGPPPKKSVSVSFDEGGWSFKKEGKQVNVLVSTSFYHERRIRWIDAGSVIIPADLQESVICIAKKGWAEAEQDSYKMWKRMSNADKRIYLEERDVNTPLLKGIIGGKFGDDKSIISLAKKVYEERYSGVFEGFFATPK